MRFKLATFLAASVAFCGISAADEVAQSKPEVVAKLPYSVGNIAFTPDNQLIFSHHPFYSPDIRVGKLHRPATFGAVPERGVEPSARGNRPLSRQRAGLAFRRGRRRMDHRHG